MKRLSAAEKGKARQEGPGPSPPKRGHDRPRKPTATPAMAPHGCGGSRPGRGSPIDEVSHAVVARPPWPRFHSAEVMPEFIVWSENPADTWLQLPRFFVGKLPATGVGGLWLQADGCCSKASWVTVEVSIAGNVALALGW